MFRSLRLKRAHTRFLESCRNLKDGRDYWAEAGRLKGWLLRAIVPMPLLGLHEDGMLLYEALLWLEAGCAGEPLTEEVIRRYHRKVTPKRDAAGGEYRRGEISVVGSEIPRAPAKLVAGLMRQLDFKLRQEQERLDGAKPVAESAVLTIAVDVYQRIGMIHPFADGNGRVSRLAMNHLLRRYGFGYVIFPPLSEASPLWEALQKAHQEEPADLEAFARRCVQPV